MDLLLLRNSQGLFDTSALNSCLRNIVEDNDRTFSLKFIKSEAFQQILTSFGDSSLDEDVKSKLLVILTKLFENLEKNQEIIKIISSKLILGWLGSTENQNKRNGYSALSVIFQAGEQIGSAILLQDGLLEEIMDCIEFESDDIQIVVTEMLSHASSHKTCRVIIKEHCHKYLSVVMTSSKIERHKAAAAITLTKILVDERNSKSVDQTGLNGVNLAQLFQNMVLNEKSDIAVRSYAIEGLAYASLNPKVKEILAYNPTLIKRFFSLVQDPENSNNSLMYGIAVILVNITSYQRPLSEKERQLLQLKKIAGEESMIEQDPLDSDDCVSKRNKQILNEGGVPILNILGKNSSHAIRQVVSQTFLNLTTDQKCRGSIAQQGGVRSLIPLALKGTQQGMSLGAQALAKIAITIDPNLAFRGEKAADLIRPFLSLCQGQNELCQFEALMALTNLGSTDNDIRNLIFDAKGIPIIENLQFSDNIMIRRAATECLCNMMYCEPVYEMYSDPGKAANKIKILLALSDVDDLETRRASSGILAILSANPDVCIMIVDRPRGIEVLRLLLIDDSSEIQHRGAECIKNIAKSKKTLAEKLVNEKVHEQLVTLVKKSKVDAVVMTAAEALKEIANHGILEKKISNY
ncbi:hypothetical protein G9A89_008357 [Geosiphon pyriformis]|nr:hypothetical protein G9A89_008357 [Geosiphon pyriformis]